MQKYSRSKQEQTISSTIFLEEPAEKQNKTKKTRETVQLGPGADASISTTPSTTRTNLRRGLLQKTATTRDRCVAHMLLRSCRDVRRPRHLPTAKTAAILQSHQDGTTKKQNLVFRRSADRGGILVLKSNKKQKTTNFSFVRIRQLSTYQV